MYLDNKYTRWYYAIIESAKSRDLVGYKENHHIIPEALGGTDAKDNMVNLTAREHFIVHHLLTKMLRGAPKYKMICAYWQMTISKKSNVRVTSTQYEHLKKIRSEYIIQLHKDPDYVKRKSESLKIKLNSPETNQKMREKGKEVQNRPERKQVQSDRIKEKWDDPNSYYNSAEYKSMVSAQQKEVQNRPEVKQKIFEKTAKRYLVTNPEGQSFEVKGLCKFCEENGLSAGMMSQLSNNKVSYYRGWSCVKL